MKWCSFVLPAVGTSEHNSSCQAFDLSQPCIYFVLANENNMISLDQLEIESKSHEVSDIKDELI